MPSVVATLLATTNSGFALVSNSGFDTAVVSGSQLQTTKGTATPSTPLAAIFQQGAATNKYSDLGVPAGANVTGIKLLSAYTFTILGATAFGNVQFFTDEANLGFWDINAIGESGVISLSKTANDYVRFLVEISGGATFDEFEDYGNFEIYLSTIEVEIFYETIVNLGGNIVSSISYDGTLTVEKRLAGDVVSSISYDGTLTVEKRLAGDVASEISYDGTLSHFGVGSLRGDIVSEIIYDGTLTIEKRLSGDIASEISYEGFLTNNSPTNRELSGNVRSSIEYDGELTWIGMNPPTPGFNLNTNLAGEITAIDRLIITDTSVNAISYQYKVNGVLRATTPTPDLTRWVGLVDGVPDEITQIVTNADGPQQLTKQVLVVPVIVNNGLALVKVLNNIPVGVSLRGRVRSVGSEGFESGWSNTDEATSS